MSSNFTYKAVRLFRQKGQMESEKDKEIRQQKVTQLQWPLVASRKSCRSLDLSHYISHLDSKQFESVLQRFYSPFAQEALACVILTILQNCNFIKDYVTHLTVLKGLLKNKSNKSNIAKNANANANDDDDDDDDDDSIEDVVVLGGAIRSVPLFVLKTSIRNTRFLVNELAAGLLALNPLRMFVPNFAYVYGYVQHPYPELEKGKINLCPQSPSPSSSSSSSSIMPKAIVIYERIPGQSLYSALAKLSASAFVSLYLQMLLVLQFAYEKIRFTHHDAHPVNVILRPVSENSVLRVPLQDQTLFCQTDGLVPTFIDFELAYFETKDMSSGGGLKPGPLIIGDAYRLLQSSLNRMREAKHPQYRDVLPLLAFFNPEDDLDDFVAWGPQFALPTPRNEKLDLRALIAYTRSWIKERGFQDPITTSLPESGHLLACTDDDDECPSYQSELHALLPSFKPSFDP